MKLYLNGWEADLVEESLRNMLSKGGKDGDNARKLLERIERCKEMQRPHKDAHLMRLDGDQPKTSDC